MVVAATPVVVAVRAVALEVAMLLLKVMPGVRVGSTDREAYFLI